MTTITQTFSYKDQSGRVLTPGVDYQYIEKWVKTLPKHEQDDFAAAQSRQHSYREEVIASGAMVMQDGNYIWANRESADTNKRVDPTWQIYFDRWLSAYNIVFETTNT